MNPRKALWLLLLIGATVLASENDAGWSTSVKGLRARLLVLPPQKEPYCRVLIEFENVDEVLGQKKIRFSLKKLSLRVCDKAGNELSRSANPYSGWAELWEPIALPYAGSMRFQISSPGLFYRRGVDKV